MKIGIDLDGVIVDTITHVSLELSRHLGFYVSPNDVANRYGEIEGADDIFVKHGVEMLCTIAPFDDTVRVINDLAIKHEIYFISARYMLHYPATLDWLTKHCLPCENVLFTEGKSKAEICKELGIEVFIEDSIRNAMELVQAGIKVILYESDYSIDVIDERLHRCSNWADVERYF